MKVYYPCPLHKQVKGLQSAGRKFLAVIAALYLGLSLTDGIRSQIRVEPIFIKSNYNRRLLMTTIYIIILSSSPLSSSLLSSSKSQQQKNENEKISKKK